jgi:hypothetical protein
MLHMEQIVILITYGCNTKMLSMYSLYIDGLYMSVLYDWDDTIKDKYKKNIITFVELRNRERIKYIKEILE